MDPLVVHDLLVVNILLVGEKDKGKQDDPITTQGVFKSFPNEYDHGEAVFRIGGLMQYFENKFF
jgi:hypothetical protein